MTHRTSSLVLLAGLVACRGHHHEAPAAATASLPAPLAHATQTDLATELDDADHRGTWSEVKQRWQGQQLHWTVTRQRSLCGSPELCNVAPFPIQRPAKHGWLPRLRFAAGEFAKLDAACGTAEQCELVIEGTLSDLQASPEMPTSMKLDAVKVVTARRV